MRKISLSLSLVILCVAGSALALEREHDPPAQEQGSTSSPRQAGIGGKVIEKGVKWFFNKQLINPIGCAGTFEKQRKTWTGAIVCDPIDINIPEPKEPSDKDPKEPKEPKEPAAPEPREHRGREH